MENQHQKIKGYRELTQDEIDLMNEVKALGAKMETLLEKVQDHIRQQRDLTWAGVDRSNGLVKHYPSDPDEHRRLELATPERFAAMSKTEFQTGLMYLTRAIAQPTTF